MPCRMRPNALLCQQFLQLCCCLSKCCVGELHMQAVGHHSSAAQGMLQIGKVALVDLQGCLPSGVQPEPLPTPPASPSVASPSFTPLTAQAASTAATAKRSSLDAGAGQALFRPFALDSSTRPVISSPVPGTLPSALAPIPAASTVTTEAEKSRPLLSVDPSTVTTAGVTSPRARSSDLKLNSRAQQAGSRSEAISTGSGAAPSRTASASTAIAAAARANAAAANAIAESGALANNSFPAASGPLPGPRMVEGFGSGVRTFTVPANPLAQGVSGPLAAAATGSQKPLQGAGSNGHPGPPANGPLLSGVFPAGRPGPLAAGQASAVSASRHTHVPGMPMSQQQRLNGTAFMTAMQQSTPASSFQGTFHGTAASAAQTAAGLPNNNQPQSEPGQQPAAYLSPAQNPQAFPNPNFRLPSGPVSFEASSNPSLRGTSLPGSSVNPSFVSSSSALNPGPHGNPAASRQHYAASGLSNPSPNPIITKPAGPHVAPGNPLSPSYKPDSGNKATSPTASQVRQHFCIRSINSTSLTCSLIHSLSTQFTQPFICACIHPHMLLFLQAFSHVFVLPCMHSFARLLFGLLLQVAPMPLHLLEVLLLCLGTGSCFTCSSALPATVAMPTLPLLHLCLPPPQHFTPNCHGADRFAKCAFCFALQLLLLPFVGILEQRQDPLSGRACLSTTPGVSASWGSSYFGHRQATANATAATIKITGFTTPRSAGALDCFVRSGGKEGGGMVGKLMCQFHCQQKAVAWITLSSP